VTTTEQIPADAPATGPDRSAPRRTTRTTVTLGPFAVALTPQDREQGRVTVLVALSYVPPAGDAATSANQAVQVRLRQILQDGLPARNLQQVAEDLYDRFAQPAWPGEGGAPVEHGIRFAQVAVSLVPREAAPGRIQPVATVAVGAPELQPGT
jgi:hypothetical protein